MIALTDSAVKKVSSMLEEADSGKTLRIFIEPGGCSGFEYGMSVDFRNTDKIGDSGGVSYAVDGDSLEYLEGCEIH